MEVGKKYVMKEFPPLTKYEIDLANADLLGWGLIAGPNRKPLTDPQAVMKRLLATINKQRESLELAARQGCCPDYMHSSCAYMYAADGLR
jgi:hypothetical protein